MIFLKETFNNSNFLLLLLMTTAINTNAKVIEYRRDYGVDYQIFYNNSLEGSAAETNGATTPPAPKINTFLSFIL